MGEEKNLESRAAPVKRPGSLRGEGLPRGADGPPGGIPRFGPFRLPEKNPLETHVFQGGFGAAGGIRTLVGFLPN